MPKKAFLLSAGFGTRFQPHTNFLPKPAMPFFNLPQALYSCALLKTAGVEQFYYNSHHLPERLNLSLAPYLGRKSIFEESILDSAGGIANAKNDLNDQENFWVANGDAFITSASETVLAEAWDLHTRTNSIATLVGIPNDTPNRNGLAFDKSYRLTGINKNAGNLHFIGLYIFNKSIFEYMKPEKTHIFTDVLLNLKEKTSVFNAKQKLGWHETGNEKDFILCHTVAAKDLRENQDNSTVYKTFKSWNKNPEKFMERFLSQGLWGPDTKLNKHVSDFLCAPVNYDGDLNIFNNCAIAEGVTINSSQKIENRLLVDPSECA